MVRTGGTHRVRRALTAFSETEDGRYMVTLTGVSRFRVRQEVSGFTPIAGPKWNGPISPAIAGPEQDGGFDRDAFFPLLERFFAHHALSTDWSSLKEADDEMLINSLSMLCPFEPDEKQALAGSAVACPRGAKRWSR